MCTHQGMCTEAISKHWCSTTYHPCGDRGRSRVTTHAESPPYTCNSQHTGEVVVAHSCALYSHLVSHLSKSDTKHHQAAPPNTKQHHPPQHDVVLEGQGHYLGLPVQWRLQCNQSGAFDEVITSKYMTHRWGYPGAMASASASASSASASSASSSSSSWEVDYTGRARPLELDDHEVLV